MMANELGGAGLAPAACAVQGVEDIIARRIGEEYDPELALVAYVLAAVERDLVGACEGEVGGGD